MDPNQTNSSTQAENLNQPQPMQPIQPQPQQPQVTPPTPPQPRQSKKFFLTLLMLFLLLFIAAVAILLSNASTQSRRRLKDTVASPVSRVTPILFKEEKELNAIDLGDIDKDFQEVEGDLQEL